MMMFAFRSAPSISPSADVKRRRIVGRVQGACVQAWLPIWADDRGLKSAQTGRRSPLAIRRQPSQWSYCAQQS